jgi:Aromatic-ring-opening dioxygenase LigAB, LigA subunit
MSLYAVQKIIYRFNREPVLLETFKADPESVLKEFELTAEERGALVKPDIGLLYVIGVNGQLLMHYAAAWGYPWADYLEAMRQGVRDHGPVRAGVYSLTGYQGVTAHDDELLQRQAAVKRN